MTENEIATIVVDLCFKIHKRYGSGLLESFYETVLVHDLRKAGLKVERQKWIHIMHDDLLVKNAFRAQRLARIFSTHCRRDG